MHDWYQFIFRKTKRIDFVIINRFVIKECSFGWKISIALGVVCRLAATYVSVQESKKLYRHDRHEENRKFVKLLGYARKSIFHMFILNEHRVVETLYRSARDIRYVYMIYTLDSPQTHYYTSCIFLLWMSIVSWMWNKYLKYWSRNVTVLKAFSYTSSWILLTPIDFKRIILKMCKFWCTPNFVTPRM